MPREVVSAVRRQTSQMTLWQSAIHMLAPSTAYGHRQNRKLVPLLERGVEVLQQANVFRLSGITRTSLVLMGLGSSNNKHSMKPFCSPNRGGSQ